MRSALSVCLALPLLAHAQSEFPDCSPHAKKPTWNLQEVTFTERQERWPDHSNATSEVSFLLSTNARPFVATCKATQPWTPPNRIVGVWYPCDMPESAIPSDLAWFTFDDVTGKIQINQTYTCWEYARTTLTRYTAFGQGYPALSCVTEQRENADWEETEKPWQWKDTDCSPVSAEFEASEISAVA